MHAVASTIGVLGLMSRRYAHRIPFIVKLNHNELLTYPNLRPVHVRLGAGGLRHGCRRRRRHGLLRSEESSRQIQEVSEAFQEAHELGMFTVLGRTCATTPSRRTAPTTPCPPISPARPTTWRSPSRPTSSSRSSRRTTGLHRIGFGKTSDLVYDELTTDNPIDLTRWQVANCYMGRIGLINSGGASSGADDLVQAVRTAVINKRAGGCGLISGRKAFQRPTHEGIELLNAIQDVYLDDSVTIA